MARKTTLRGMKPKPDIARYDFCVFRIPENSGRAIWEITNACNYSCSYCGFSADKTKRSDELTTKEIFRALEGLNQSGFTYIKFTGGEPFMRNDLFDILAKANELGFVSDLSTNASLITPEKAKVLASLNLKMVHSSIDGHDKATHELARGHHTYDLTIKGVRHLVDQGIYVRIGSVVFKENEDHLSDMVKSIASLGANEIIFSYMEPEGHMKGDDSLTSRRPAAELKQELEELAYQYDGKIIINHSFTEEDEHYEEGICPGVHKLLFINNLGQIAPCHWLVEEKPEYWSEITLKQHPFKDVINSDSTRAYLAHVERLRQEGYRGCPVRKR